jgi:hypothetical protein
MLLLLQKAIIKAPPTVTDSLKHSLAQMQNKIDSLEKVVLKTEIGTGYFTEIISLQLGVLLFLAGIAGWIGWGSIIKSIKQQQADLDLKFTSAMNEQKEVFNDETKQIKKTLLRTSFNVNRTTYKAIMSDADHKTLFYWALSAAKSLFIFNPKNTELLITWLDLVKKHIEAITEADEGFRRNLIEDLTTLNEIEETTSRDARKLLKEIKSRVYILIYSPNNSNADISDVTPDENDDEG